jgi:hypothetical protein
VRFHQVSDRVILFRLRFAASQARRKNKDAPNLGHPILVRHYTVEDLAFMDDLKRIPVRVKYIGGVVSRIVFQSCPR